MQTHKFRTVLKIAAMSLVGLVSKTNANAQSTKVDEYYETRENCKLINNKSQVVINHRDTLQVYGIEIIREGGQKKIVCDLGPGNAKLVFDPLYYINNPWLPPIYKGDTVAYEMLQRDARLTYLYYVYEDQGDEKRRDSIEDAMLENRRQLMMRTENKFYKQY